MIYEKIKVSALVAEKRFEAKYFLNAYASTVRKMVESKLQFDTLSAFGKVFNPNVFKRQFCDKTESAIPYRQSHDIVKHFEEPSAYLPSAQVSKLNLAVKENWIIITGFGTIVGDVTLVDKHYAGNAFANNVCRFMPDDNVKYGFICAFLKSNYGKSQFNKNASGSTIRYIEAPVVRKTLIPRLSPSTVTTTHDMIIKANQLRDDANDIMTRVNLKLHELLNIEEDKLIPLSASTEKKVGATFIIQSGHLNAKTFRARNYGLRKQSILDVFQSVKFDKLGSLLAIPPSYGARFKRIEATPELGIELLSQSDIFSVKPEGRIISKRSLKNLDKEIVKKGTTLIPAQGTLGENEIFAKAKFVYGYLEEKLVAGHVMRFVPNESKIPSGYLHAILNSPLWFRLFRSSVYGTNLLGFITDLLVEYPIPRFSTQEEADIDAMVKKAYEAFTEANRIEVLAISIIEQEIESWQK